MNEREKEILREVLKEMENAYGIIKYWLKGSPIEKTLGSWIETLSRLHDGTYDS